MDRALKARMMQRRNAEGKRMSEGYWEQVGDAHHIDLRVLRSMAFRLLCIVEASRGLVRNLDAIGAEREEEGEELTESDLLLVAMDTSE